ncbi:MAG: hydroxymethylglutaryl-CoA reductase, degradative [Candidatus Bathyarchaeota archaeon]|jgi:hydroxymethylglutaryl-CoA reductase|nr:hydroxymethylglutaryl-CoA reductase, degradative [Candidatus Bathyarchaeota archaeon]
MKRSSQISGFYKLHPEERLEIVKTFAQLSTEETQILSSTGGIKLEQADRMIENVIGVMPIPVGIAVNFLINGRDYLIPMAIEEPSVVAAASYAAKMARSQGGFTAHTTGSVMIGQVQIVNIKDPYGARMAIFQAKEEILTIANEQDPVLVSLGGGAKDLQARIIHTSCGPMVIVELLVDCKDAMGANAVNTMAEAVAPLLERVTGGQVYLRIISNLAIHRLARAKVVIPKDAIGGASVVDGVILAYAFAAADSFRCATHNKGIMNGITAVVLATGNDTRAIEAGAHVYAALSGRYQPLTTWEKNGDGDLVGTIELPLAVGLVGGATRAHPVARTLVKILGVTSAAEFAEVLACVGLAQNLAALRALANEGIQRGHMALHARNIAVEAGATVDQIARVVQQMIEENMIRTDRAKQILLDMSDA